MERQINSCPCCGGSLLRHVRHGEIYWFCTSCCQKVPLLTGCRTPRAETLSVSESIASVKPSRPIQPLNS